MLDNRLIYTEITLRGPSPLPPSPSTTIPPRRPPLPGHVAQAYLNVYPSTPAISTDDSTMATTSTYASAIRLENLTNHGYSTFTLNASGMAGISKLILSGCSSR